MHSAFTENFFFFFTLSDVIKEGFCLSHVEKPKIMISVQLALGKSCILRL